MIGAKSEPVILRGSRQDIATSKVKLIVLKNTSKKRYFFLTEVNYILEFEDKFYVRWLYVYLRVYFNRSDVFLLPTLSLFIVPFRLVHGNFFCQVLLTADKNISAVYGIFSTSERLVYTL